MINQTKEINYSKIANKEIQEEMLDKINKLADNSNDDLIDLVNNINSAISNTDEKIQGLNSNLINISSSISGDGSTNTGYGTGAMGSITYNPSTTIWPELDAYGRYIWNCTNFTLPANVTMIPPEKNNGLYIYCTGTCTINGTIDVKAKRLTLNGSNGITNYIIIKGNKYYLAKGGNTVKGGDGGAGGNYIFTADDDSDKPTRYAGGKASEIVYAGNINGGGTSTYGTGGISPGNGAQVFVNRGTSALIGSAGYTSNYRETSGAIILAASSVVIGANGLLDCRSIQGKICGNGSASSIIEGDSDPSATIICGTGGDGAIAPTGGGCVTIVTDSFTNNGQILTSGNKIECTGNGTFGLVSQNIGGGASSWDFEVRVYGSSSGGDGTFISQAGEIKVYVLGG